MSFRFAKLGSFAVTGWALASLWSGCAGEKDTQVVPGVTTQIQIPKSIRGVRIDVQSSVASACFSNSVDPRESEIGSITLPSTVGVFAAKDPNHKVTITVRGFDKSPYDPGVTWTDCSVKIDSKDFKILRRAQLFFVEGRLLFVPMPLRYSCFEQTDCKDDETCTAGECTKLPDAQEATAAAVDFQPELMDGKSKTCFDPSVCMSDALQARLLDPTTCTFDYPTTPAKSGVNVRVTWDGGEVEYLDEDKAEGFTVVPGSPQRFMLAPTLCKMFNKDPSVKRKILRVDMGTVCSPKSGFQPVCESQVSRCTPEKCAQRFELKPSPSAVYFLLDDSKSMAPLYSTTSTQEALALSLTDPVLENTFVGFSRLTHSNTDCSTGRSLASVYGGKFVNAVEATRAKNGSSLVADFLAAQAPQADDKPFLLDAVFRQDNAIAAFGAAELSKVTRKAVVLMLNRDPAGSSESCQGKTINDAVVALQAARAAGVQTYVLMLGNTVMPDVAGANQLAQAGGTTSVFDLRNAKNDPLAIPNAFNQIVADVGTCSYEPPAGVTLSEQSAISFVSPVDMAASSETSVPYSTACAVSTRDSVDGWSLVDGKVLVCGKPCSSMRDAVKNGALLAMQASATSAGDAGVPKQHPLPALPVFVRVPSWTNK